MEALTPGTDGHQHIVGGTYDGKVIGTGLSLVPGKLGQALDTGANSAYVELGQEHRGTCFGTPDLCTNGYSLALWLYRRSYSSGEAYYVCTGGQTGSSFGISIHGKPDGKLGFDFKTKTHWYRLTHPVTFNAWHHVAFSWTPTDNLKAYVDGKYVGTSGKNPNTRATTQWNTFFIGKPNNNNWYYGSAYIDEILFWNSYKQASFFQTLFQFYENPNQLHFVSQTAFLHKEGVRLKNVASLGSCQPPPWNSGSPHPCRLQCMWLVWCGAVVYDGKKCHYYNIYGNYNDLVLSDPGSLLFVVA